MAKDVITRFKLETTQYDSKIKNAAKELSDIAKSAKSAGADFERFTKDSLEAARSLGTIETSSVNAKDRAKELVGAFNDVARSYNQLTEEQKKSDFGNAVADSLTHLQQRIRETKEEMKGLEAGGGGLFGGDKLSGMLQVFGGNLMTKGVELAASAMTSLISETGDMIKQGVELAKQGEGIRIAFDRLGRGDILQGLREATHGTVTDLELMKAAVKFNDFKLPLDELGTMLAFAQQKAKDTGQSVDYMVDSIVTGLGRKSLMILDNLGLSAAEIKERMKETGDMTKAVGAIIRDQMVAAGDYVETAADRAAQANVNLQNKMEELGRKFAPIEEASNQLWTSIKIGILDIVGGPLAQLLNGLTEAGRLKNALNDINGDGSSGNTVVGGKLKQLQAAKNSGASQYTLNTMQSSTIEGYNRQIMKADELLKQFEKNHSSVNVVLQNATKQFGQKFSSISELEAFRDAYKVIVSDYRKGASEIMKPVKVNIQTDNAIKSVDELKVKLAELQAQRKKVAAGSDEAKRLDTEIRQVKADIKLQDPNAVKTTATTTPKEKASEMVSTAERTYAETLEKAAIRMEVGLDSELENKKKALSAQERLFDAYNDAYAIYKDPKYKEAANEAANKIKSLAGEVKQMEDAVKAAKIKWEQGASGFNQKTISEWMQGRQSDLSKAEYGTKEYKDISANIADMSSIKTVFDTAIKNAIDTTQIDMTPLWSKMFDETLSEGATASLSDALTKMYEQAFDGVNIDDTSLQNVIDKINEKLKEMKLDGIKIDFTTGEIARNNRRRKNDKNDDTKYKEVNLTKEFGAMTGGISQIVGGLEQLGIEIPAGLQSVLGGMQAITTILTGIAATIIAIEALVGADTFLPFAGGGIVRAAGGTLVGNSYSGDNLRGIGPGGQIYGLNAGEVVLNRAQAGVLANELQGGGIGNLGLSVKVTAEELRFVLGNNSRRRGKGEYVTSRRLR